MKKHKKLDPEYLAGFNDGIEFKEAIDVAKVDEWDKWRKQPKNINNSDESDICELKEFLKGNYDDAETD